MSSAGAGGGSGIGEDSRAFHRPFIATHLSTLHTNVLSLISSPRASQKVGTRDTYPWSPARACTESLHRWRLTSQITRGKAGRRQGGAKPTALPTPLASSPSRRGGACRSVCCLSSISLAWSSVAFLSEHLTPSAQHVFLLSL